MLNKYVLVLILVVAAGAGGYYMGRGMQDVKIIEKSGETHTVYKDRVVTVTRIVHPDGRIEETTKTEDRSGKKDEKIVDKDESRKAVLAQYMVGAGYWVEYSNPKLDDYTRSLEVRAATRLVGPLWLGIGVRKESASLYTELEF